MKLLSLAPVVGLLTSCALTPPPAQVRVVVVPASPGPASGVASATAPASTSTAPASTSTAPASGASMAPTRPPPATSAPANRGRTTMAKVHSRPATAMAPPVRRAASTGTTSTAKVGTSYADCTVRRYSTGWVEADCAEMRLLIQGGFATRGNRSFRASIAAERVGRLISSSQNSFATPASVLVGNRTVQGRDIVIRRPKVRRTMFGESRRRDPAGDILHRAVYAVVKTPNSGNVGVSCVASAGEFRRARCVAMINRVARHGVPGGAVKGGAVSVSGIRLRMGRRCWSPNPQGIYCLNRGGLQWRKGTHGQMAALRQKKIANGFGLGVKPNHKRVVSERKCKVGSKRAMCTRVDYWGLANFAVYTFHLAIVANGDQSTAFFCRVNNSKSSAVPPPACQQIFNL